MLGDSVEREIGKNLSNLAEQWGGLNVAAQAMIDKLIARNDKLQAELDEAKTQLAEQIASGGEDGSEWVELAKSALDVVTGKATKEALGRIAQRMIASGAIDPNTSKEIIAALNQAVASENMGVNPLTLITGGKESAK
jgi:F0F1-type ATP synthase membrane subunit b/b'